MTSSYVWKDATSFLIDWVNDDIPEPEVRGALRRYFYNDHNARAGGAAPRKRDFRVWINPLVEVELIRATADELARVRERLLEVFDRVRNTTDPEPSLTMALTHDVVSFSPDGAHPRTLMMQAGASAAELKRFRSQARRRVHSIHHMVGGSLADVVAYTAIRLLAVDHDRLHCCQAPQGETKTGASCQRWFLRASRGRPTRFCGPLCRGRQPDQQYCAWCDGALNEDRACQNFECGRYGKIVRSPRKGIAGRDLVVT